MSSLDAFSPERRRLNDGLSAPSRLLNLLLPRIACALLSLSMLLFSASLSVLGLFLTILSNILLKFVGIELEVFVFLLLPVPSPIDKELLIAFYPSSTGSKPPPNKPLSW